MEEAPDTLSDLPSRSFSKEKTVARQNEDINIWWLIIVAAVAGGIFLLASLTNVWDPIGISLVGNDDAPSAQAADNCPAGLVCTPVQAQCPAGMICTPIGAQSQPVAPSSAAPAITASATCPTDGEMQALFGFDKMSPQIKPVFTGQSVPWEPCKWSLQWTGPGSMPLPMLQGWQFTVTMSDDSVVVWYGDNAIRSIKGATIRFLTPYAAMGQASAAAWVTDGCTLLHKEAEFGHNRNPSYETISGNVCSGNTSTFPGSSSAPAAPSLAPASASTVALAPSAAPAAAQPAPPPAAVAPAPAAVAPAPAAPAQPAPSSCFADASAVAAAVGGSSASWYQEDPTNFPNTWKFKQKGTNVSLRHPGSPVATIDYWNGGVRTATQAGALPVSVDEATAKC